jgi:protein associated with RNAse G/E
MVTPCRYDGSPKFRYPVDALALDDRRWVVHGVFGPEIGSHSGRLGFYPGDHTIEFYLVETWWNAYAVFSPAGAPRGYYCNIATPPRREADAIVYTDLDLDLLVRPDGSAVVLDRDEYEERAARFGYPADLRRQVDAALAEVTALAERRADLFDGGEAAVFFRRAVAMGGARA